MDEFALWVKSGGLWELDGFYLAETQWMTRLDGLSGSRVVEDWRVYRVRAYAWPSSLPGPSPPGM